MMPLPTHLRECVIPDSTEIDESGLRGEVRCSCGSTEFHLLYPGQTHEWEGKQIPCTAEIDGNFFFLVKAKCAVCGLEHLLIDQDFHGWDGFVCHDPDQAELPRPELISWPCSSCDRAVYLASVSIETQGKEDFVEETDGEFPAERWPDGFSWFSMDIKCAACGKEEKDWVSLETM